MFKTDYFTNKQMAIMLILNKYMNIFVITDDRKNLHPFPLKSLGVHTE